MGKDSARNLAFPKASRRSVGGAGLSVVDLSCAWAAPAVADPVPGIEVTTASCSTNGLRAQGTYPSAHHHRVRQLRRQ